MPSTITIQNGHLFVFTNRDNIEDTSVFPKNSFSIELTVHTPVQQNQLDPADLTQPNPLYSNSGVDSSSLLIENSEVLIRNVNTGEIMFNLSYKLPLTRLSVALAQEYGSIKKAGQSLQDQLLQSV